MNARQSGVELSSANGGTLMKSDNTVLKTY
nr:MAG TPA: hypothetical protein [Caudoviricetes sp.]